jgi:hypothetical protein
MSHDSEGYLSSWKSSDKGTGSAGDVAFGQARMQVRAISAAVRGFVGAELDANY